MSSIRVRSIERLTLAAAILVAGACGGSGPTCGGCGGGCLAPLPTDYAGVRIDNGVTMRVSKDGFDFINQNWQKVIAQVTTNPIVVNMPCSSTTVSVPLLGNRPVWYCDQNTNKRCDTGEACTITVKLTNIVITPQPVTNPPVPTGRIDLTAVMEINTGDIGLSVCAIDAFGVCVCDLKCFASFDSTRGSRRNENFVAPVTLSVDTKWGRLTRFEVGQISGINQLESADLTLRPVSSCTGFVCSIFDIDFIKRLIMDQFLKPQLNQRVKDAVDSQACRGCTAGANCSAGPLEGTCCPPTGSSCNSSNRCIDDANGACLPRLLGVQGAMDFSTLGGFGTGLGGGGLPMLAALGGSVSSDDGLSLGMVTGAEAAIAAPCAVDLPPPAPKRLAPPDFEKIAAEPRLAATGYHLAFGVSQYYLDTMMHGIHRAGGMCVAITSRTSAFLSTGTFKVLLPSLGLIAGTPTRDAPVMIVLRPQKAPTFVVGDGEVDPVTKKAKVSDLLTLTMNDVGLDFYALVDDRFARIFSLIVDVRFPLSMIIEGGCQNPTPPPGTGAQGQKLTLVLGDLKQLFTNIRVANAALIAEDPAVLGQLIPMVIGLAEPALAGALKPIDVPDMNGFLVKLTALRGIVPTGVAGQYEHVGAFAALRFLGGPCSGFSPRTQARLVESRMPAESEMRLGGGRPLPWPAAVIDVAADGDGRPVEHAWRVNGGLWSQWQNGPTLVVEHPAFLAQGRHTIDVRSQAAGDSDTIEAVPARVSFLVDWQAPQIELTPHRDRGILEVRATDAVTPDDRIQFAYRLGDGPVTDFGPRRPVSLAASEASGGRVEVFARDEAGLVRSAIWRMSVGRGPDRPVEESSAIEARGCAAAGGAALPGAAVLLAAMGRRTRRPFKARGGRSFSSALPRDLSGASQVVDGPRGGSAT